MNDPALIFSRLLDDDSSWRVIIKASTSEFAGALEVKTHSERLSEFGRQLIAFPSGPDDEVRLEIGSHDGNWPYYGNWPHYLMLRAFLLDRSGHSSLEFICDNRLAPPRHAQAGFFIPCEVADINRLGRQLQAWVGRSDEPLAWSIATG